MTAWGAIVVFLLKSLILPSTCILLYLLLSSLSFSLCPGLRSSEVNVWWADRRFWEGNSEAETSVSNRSRLRQGSCGLLWQHPKGFLCLWLERGEHKPGEPLGWVAEHGERNYISLQCHLDPGGTLLPQTKPGFILLEWTDPTNLGTPQQGILLWSKGKQVLTEGDADIFQVRNLS